MILIKKSHHLQLLLYRQHVVGVQVVHGILADYGTLVEEIMCLYVCLCVCGVLHRRCVSDNCCLSSHKSQGANPSQLVLNPVLIPLKLSISLLGPQQG